jgi:hypothetical protein
MPPETAELTDGLVDPTAGAALVRLGYDRDFPLIGEGAPGSTGPAVPAPGWWGLRHEHIDLDEWGYPILTTDTVPCRLTSVAAKATAECPTPAPRPQRMDDR